MIRHAVYSDFYELLALNWYTYTLNGNVYINEYAEDTFLSILQSKSTVMFVYEKNNKLVGRIEIHQGIFHGSLIEGLYVADEYRQQGIAHALLIAAIKQAKKWGMTHCKLCVVRDNVPAFNLYIKAGFQIDPPGTGGIVSMIKPLEI